MFSASIVTGRVRCLAEAPPSASSVMERTGWSVALVSAAVTTHFLVGVPVVANMQRLFCRRSVTVHSVAARLEKPGDRPGQGFWRTRLIGADLGGGEAEPGQHLGEFHGRGDAVDHRAAVIL